MLGEVATMETRRLQGLADLLPSPRAVAVALAVVTISFVVARGNYVLFHTVAEGFALMVAVLIYVVGTRTFKHSHDTFLLFLGTAYLFVAILDFFHTMTYQGTGVFPGYTSDTPTQLWIAGRYVDALSLLLAGFFIRRSFPQRTMFWLYAAVTTALVASIMVFRVFPAAFVPDQGLTPFKVASEYLISLILFGAILHLRSRSEHLDGSVYMLLVAAMAVTILSEMSFTLYTDVYGLMNLVGHLFKILAYYLVFRAIVERGLEAPYLEVKRLNEGLERRVRQRTKELEAANLELRKEVAERKQLEEQREDLLRAVSHDLRNPLTAVLGQSQYLERAMAKAGLDANLLEGARSIQVGAQRMNAMIGDLVESARSESGQLRLDSEPIDLASFVREVVHRTGPSVEAGRIEVEMPAGLPPVDADPNRLERIFANLISNALKYSDENTPVRIGAESLDGEVVVAVRDSGRGIDRMDLEHIFERFYRARGARKAEGLGIGLYTTRMLVEAHGGRIWVESEPGTGSTFSFTLPLAAD